MCKFTVKDQASLKQNFCECLQKGDRVCTVRSVSGSYAEYATAEDKYVNHLSDKLSFAQGAAIGIPYYTAVKALQIRSVLEIG